MTQVLALQAAARSEHAKRPFAAILVGPDHETVLLRHQSVSHVEHAEASLARLASVHYSQAYLWTCTMYSTWEPCAMCAATSMFYFYMRLLLSLSILSSRLQCFILSWTRSLTSLTEDIPNVFWGKTAYWANIGRVIFGASNDRLMELTGAGNGENFTMRWGCAEVIGGGQKETEVVGPLADWEDKVSGDADLYWAGIREKR